MSLPQWSERGTASSKSANTFGRGGGEVKRAFGIVCVLGEGRGLAQGCSLAAVSSTVLHNKELSCLRCQGRPAKEHSRDGKRCSMEFQFSLTGSSSLNPCVAKKHGCFAVSHGHPRSK